MGSLPDVAAHHPIYLVPYWQSNREEEMEPKEPKLVEDLDVDLQKAGKVVGGHPVDKASPTLVVDASSSPPPPPPTTK
jgi:hypothetical protein